MGSIAQLAKWRDTWFKSELRDNTYDTGEAYDDELALRLRSNWDIHPTETRNAYLMHVKNLANQWPNLKLLADFMEVGTTPIRWKDTEKTVDNQNERAAKIKVSRLDYEDGDSEVNRKDLTTSDELKDELDKKTSQSTFSLYVVEDLSRDMIEILGSKLKIDPSFFREHIVDYAWFNVRDPWRNPPNLDLVTRQQDWIQIRFSTARYFDKSKGEGHAFDDAFEESKKFNILRRPDNDLSNMSFWDKDDAAVGLTRSRASFWLEPNVAKNGSRQGVLLLDPTYKKGAPLWRGYRNWGPICGLPTPSPVPLGPGQESFYEDFLFWARKPEIFMKLAPSSSASKVHVPMQALLHLICAEWLTISEYINTRLTQIDWEIAFPETFLKDGVNIDSALKKLHMWRRFVPLYHEMVSETLRRVFQFPCHVPPAAKVLQGDSSYESATTPPTPHPCNVENTQADSNGPINAYRRDFALVLSYMEAHQKRIDRLTTVAAAVISIADSHRGLSDNRNLRQLTWLATLFLPFSLIATTFCMQLNVRDITDTTVRYYFAVALPFAIMILALAIILSLPSVQKRFGFAQYRLGGTNPKKKKKEKKNRTNENGADTPTT